MSETHIRLSSWELTQGSLRAVLKHYPKDKWRLIVDPLDGPAAYEGNTIGFVLEPSGTEHLKALRIAGEILEIESRFISALESLFSTRADALQASVPKDDGSPEPA